MRSFIPVIARPRPCNPAVLRNPQGAVEWITRIKRVMTIRVGVTKIRSFEGGFTATFVPSPLRYKGRTIEGKNFSPPRH